MLEQGRLRDLIEYHLVRVDVGDVIHVDFARMKKVIVDITQEGQDAFCYIYRLGILLWLIEFVLEDVENAKQWKPSLRIRYVKVFQNSGHLREHVDQKSLVPILKEDEAALLY